MNQTNEPRLLKEREMEQAKAVWDACFVNTPEFTRWYFDTRAIPERVMGLFEGGKLISNTLMVPYRIKLRGKSMSAPYIVGAATLEEHRRKGHMERVLGAALEHMHGLGASVTFLHPFRYGFYRKLGWERATSGLVYKLGAEKLARLCGAYAGSASARSEKGTRPDSPEMFEPVARGDGDRLRPIYQAMTGDAELTLLRGERECAYRVEETLIEGGFGIVGERAYALMFQSGEKLNVFELAYARADALYPLLAAMAGQPGVKTLSFMLPPWEAQPERLMDEAPPELTPYLMMRVVDVEKALTGLKLGSLTGSFVLEIHDELCPWNGGAYEVELSGGISQAKRTSRPADVSMDVSVLAMLVSGYMRFDAAQDWRLVRVQRENALLSAAFTSVKGFVLEKY